MPRIKLIMNSQADRGRANRQANALQSLVDNYVLNPPYGDGPYEVEWAGTNHPGHATDLAQDAAEQGYDIVAAVGGDGTIHEIINGLMQASIEKRPTLGLVPLGSGNDFAYNVGVRGSPADNLKQLFSHSTRTIDIAKITDGSGRTRYWDNAVNIGFSGAIAIATRNITRIHGFAMYMTATLQTIAKNFDAPRLTVQFDDQTIERELMMVVVANGPREGGGFHIAPNAKLDDGLLDYVYFEKVGRARMLRLLPAVMAGKHLRFEDITAGTAKRISVESDSVLPVDTDGEIFGPWEANIRRIDIEVVPQALQVAIQT